MQSKDISKYSFYRLKKKDLYNLFWHLVSPIRKYFIVAAFLHICFFGAFAERLPLKTYSTADGLANDDVNKIVADSRGFLWFCTGEGLSRFDGYRFKNYTQEQGLPHRNVNDFLETQDGTYLIATNGGLSVFNPLGKAFRWNFLEGRLEQTANDAPMFKTYLTPESQNDKTVSKNISSLTQDSNGDIFALTNYGIFRVSQAGEDWQFEKTVSNEWNVKPGVFNFLLIDSRKNIWIAASHGIFLMSKNGEIRKINNSGGNTVFEDKQGKIWVDSGGLEIGIRVYEFQNGNSEPTLTNTFTKKDGLEVNGFTNAIAQTGDGRIFVTSKASLHEFMPNAKIDEPKFRRFENEVATAAIDKIGNAWFTLPGKGVGKFSQNSFEVFDERDGIPRLAISSIFGNHRGDIFLAIDLAKILRFANGKFESLVPFGATNRNWGTTFLDFESRDGEWWVLSENGLRRYPKVANFKELEKTPPKKIYTTTDGLFSNAVFNLFEDSSGDIWINAANSENSLVRWERKTEKIYQYTAADGLPKNSGAVSFGEDPAGNIWIGFFYGQIVRFKDGKFRSLTDESLIPLVSVTEMLSDQQGGFWLATKSRGLFRVENPNDEKPVFSNFSTADGLSSNQALCLTDDNFGRIYIGTGLGINRFDAKTKSIKIYTKADGLPGSTISQCYKDVNGNLWFSSNNSLIKYVPKAEKSAEKPPIFIDGINVNGTPRKISELGETETDNLEFASDEKQIQISFFAISFDSGETLRYQYKLEGQEWSEPGEQRTVDLNLSSGTYNFAVQAINSDGIVSEKPATITFKILPPIYQRWWFLILAAAIVFSILFIIYHRRTANLRRINSALSEAKFAEEALSNSRNERLKELQKVRSRIATDLHDDIGSSLTQISVYSELARQRESENGKAGEPLDMISNVANELVDTMSDIVWAINPKKDHLQDLTQRMRRYAANVLTAKEIEMTFLAPASETEIPLGANIRREVFLIFKETVNNIVKHSQATKAEITFSLQTNFLEINFKDNGAGFDQNANHPQNGQQAWRKFRGGNGLLNMKKRAEELSGSYEIESKIGDGTTVVLKVPLEINQ